MTTHFSPLISTKSTWSTESKQICYKPVLFFSMTLTTSFSLKLISPFPPAANSATEWYLSTNSSSFRPVGDVTTLLLWQDQEELRYLRYKINLIVLRYKKWCTLRKNYVFDCLTVIYKFGPRIWINIFKKQKTCTVFLLSYGNTSGTLGKMLWEHKS